MAIAASDILDLVTTTLKDLGRARFTDLGTAKNNFVAYKNLMTRERITIESGTALQWNIVVRNSGAARSVGLFNVDAPNVSDVMQTATAPWRFLTTNYSFDEKEPLMNGGKGMWYGEGGYRTRPTHWMPLPTPPKEAP